VQGKRNRAAQKSRPARDADPYAEPPHPLDPLARLLLGHAEREPRAAANAAPPGPGGPPPLENVEESEG
jgi:hypothetical protein